MPIQVSQDEGRAYIRIEGPLTIYGASEARDVLLATLAGTETMEIDLSDLDELDVAGVQLMLALKQHAQRVGKACSFLHHSPAAREVIDLLNLSSALGDPVVIPA